jgi:hypothetical protein
MSLQLFGLCLVVFGLWLAVEGGSLAVLGVFLVLVGLGALFGQPTERVCTKEYIPSYHPQPTPATVYRPPTPAPVYRPPTPAPVYRPPTPAQISNSEEKAIQNAFRKIDRNGNDEIDFYELKTALSDLGFFPISNQLVQSMMDEADAVFLDGKIDYQEFKKICTKAFCSSDWTRVRNRIKNRQY